MNIKKHIPNAITCGNLLCGCLAIVSAFKGDLIWSAYLVGIAAVLDFFDGFAARMLNAHSEIGKQLDSLADMVTFGVVPGVVMFQMIKMSENTTLYISDIYFGGQVTGAEDSWICYIAFLIPIFSAIRLAKFNIDTHQSESFIGLPTPANAILICSLPLIFDQIISNYGTQGITIYPPLSALGSTEFPDSLASYFKNVSYILIGITILMSFLLVAPIPLFALKFKNFMWADNKIRYLFLIISLILLIVFQFIAIPFIIFLYIILSMINNIMNKKIPNA